MNNNYCGDETPFPEPFGPEYVRPRQIQMACPDCRCCTAQLCARGRTSVLECVGHAGDTDKEQVRGCPCSAETAEGSLSWRAAKIRAVNHALGRPLGTHAENTLRDLAAGQAVPGGRDQVRHLVLWRYAHVADGRASITELGHAYLAGRDEPRLATFVHVQSVDEEARTANVVVIGWSLEHEVTVPMDQLTNATALTPQALVGRRLEAMANCGATRADDVVLTGVVLPADAPADWSDGAE